MNPEMHLKRLNKELKKLYKDVAILENEKLRNKILKLSKKITMAELAYEEYMIAVTGLQGVGKTTLLKNFFNIEDGYLPEVIGIGERIPIIISEGDKYQTIVRKIFEINKEFEIKEINVEKEEFFNITTNPGPMDICLKLIVPSNNFKNKDRAFILLPGVDQDRSEWNDLAKQCLKFSANTIVAFNETKMAYKGNDDFVEELFKECEQSKPLIALTYSDQSNDGNCGLRDEAIKKFKFYQEEDRIICTSTDKKDIEKWKEKISKAISKYSKVSKVVRKNQIDELEKLISRDLTEIISLVRSNIVKYQVSDIDEADETVEEILEIIESQRTEIQEYYEKELEKWLEDIQYRANENLEKKILGKKNIDKLKEWVFGESLREKREFNNLLINSWEEEKINDMEDKILSKMLSEKFPLYKTLGYMKEKEIKESSMDECAITSLEETRKNITQGKEHLMNINKILNKDSTGQLTEKMNKSIKYIPLLAVELIRINNNMRIKKIQNQDLDSIKKIERIELNLFENVKVTENERRNVIKGAGMLLGIDSLDGSIDSIPGILKFIGIEKTMSLIVPAVGCLSGVLMIKNIINTLNKKDIQDAEQGKIILEAVKESEFKNYSNSFKDSMDIISDMLEEKIKDRYSCGEKFSRKLRAVTTLQDIIQIREKMRDEIGEYRACIE